MDSISTLSSPHAHDINLDGVLDIVIGGGVDGAYRSSGVMAINGSTGDLLWTSPSRNEVFGSAIFQDITGDGKKEVFITGREAQLYALNGQDGSVLWDFFPYGTDPADSGWYNFYNPQFIDDIDGDSFQDILVTNGGDHSAPEWETDRPPGQILVFSSLTGDVLASTVVPDSAETYCSPIVVDLQNNGTKWVLIGTGGENLGGGFYACPLASILNNNTNGSILLDSDPDKGFIAPASVHYNDTSGAYDFIIVSFDGKTTKINGNDFSTYWTYQHSGTETSAEPVLGNFTGDLTPDVFLTLFKGVAPAYSDFYQVMLDGSTGELKFIDSLGELNYASGNAVDLNNDGRDEAVSSVSYWLNGYYQYRIEAVDFVSNTTSSLSSLETGLNLGSTPLIRDIDNDQNLELVYAYKKDSLNPGATDGIYVKRIDLSSIRPNAGVAWGTYLGTNYNGEYAYFPSDCGMLSVLSGLSVVHPSCNNELDGSIIPIPIGTAGPYTYNWSTGSLATAALGLGAGSYWVRVTNRMGCYEEREVLLSDPYLITFGAIASPTCIGGDDGNATLSSSGCPCMFSGCTFLWENGGTGKPNDSLVAGWNSVTITHTDGCVVTDSVLVPEPDPSLIDYSIESVLCYGDSNGSITLELDSLYAPIVEWGNGSDTTYMENLSAGIYELVISDSRGCVDSMTLEVSSPDDLVLETDHTSWLCHGEENGEIVLMLSGGTPSYTYEVNGTLYQNNSISGLAEGTYSILVSDTNGCVQTDEVSMEMLDPFDVTFDVIHSSGESTFDGIVISSVMGGLPPYSYDWNTGSTESVIVYLPPGEYVLNLTDSIGCAFSDTVIVGILGSIEETGVLLEAYPNPTTGVLYFNKTVAGIEVYNLAGERVLTKEEGNSIDLSMFVQGAYIISIDVNGRSRQFKVLRTSD